MTPKRRALFRLGTAAFITLITGTVFYHIVESLTWVDSFYFSVVTLATVGYGDITPHTDLGKLFTAFYILIGVGIIGAYVSSQFKYRAQKFHDGQHSPLIRRGHVHGTPSVGDGASTESVEQDPEGTSVM